MKTTHNKVLVFYHFQVCIPIGSLTTTKNRMSPLSPTTPSLYFCYHSDHYKRCIASFAPGPEQRTLSLQIQVRNDGRE